MEEVTLNSETEFPIDNDRQRYLSLISLFVFTFFIAISIYSFDLFNQSFKALLLPVILWQGLALLIRCRTGRIGDRYLFLVFLPLISLTPLFILTIDSESEIMIYNIILAFCTILIQLSNPFKGKLHTCIRIIFLIEYLIVFILFKQMGYNSYFQSGGFLLHLLIVSLGISQRNNEAQDEKLQLYRNAVRNYKETLISDPEGDPILGIFSKSGGMKVLKQMMKWSERYELPLTICYMELQCSHDDYINTITRGIFKRIRGTDTLFRLGRSEMLLILPDCEKRNAAGVIDYIKEKLEKSQKDKIRYGLADFKSQLPCSPNELIINANRASYPA